METKRQHLKGSALVFSMLVLTMLLAIAVSGATITIATKKSSRGSEKSILALQTADGALEAMFLRVYKYADTNLDDVANNAYGTGVTCAGGTISGQLPSGSGSYAVTFFDSADQKIACSDAAWRSKLIYMVAVGTFAGTTRAISVGITPP
jgi:Tfp pilus assembly protein PilX